MSPTPAMERGFNPDNVYEIGEIDQVNLFNGNLTAAIPLGPSYQVGGGFSYRFHPGLQRRSMGLQLRPELHCQPAAVDLVRS